MKFTTLLYATKGTIFRLFMASYYHGMKRMIKLVEFNETVAYFELNMNYSNIWTVSCMWMMRKNYSFTHLWHKHQTHQWIKKQINLYFYLLWFDLQKLLIKILKKIRKHQPLEFWLDWMNIKVSSLIQSEFCLENNSFMSKLKQRDPNSITVSALSQTDDLKFLGHSVRSGPQIYGQLLLIYLSCELLRWVGCWVSAR